MTTDTANQGPATDAAAGPGGSPEDLTDPSVGKTPEAKLRERKNKKLISDGYWPWVFVAPLFTGIAIFYLWPIIHTGYTSLTETGPFGGYEFVGLGNYVELFADPRLYLSLGNTLLYMGVVLLSVPIAVYLASLLNLPGLRFASFYRVLFFLPYVAMPAAIAMVWRIMFNGDFGIINWLLAFVGIDGPYWVSTAGTAMLAVSIVGLWSLLGFNMIILGAGLKNIPPELYEAASIDGASRWRQFISITVPLLSPSIFFVMVITVITSFQVFDLLYAILGSNSPVLPQSMSLVYFFYREGFVNNDQGYAAAIAILILVVIGLVTAFQFWFQRKWVHND